MSDIRNREGEGAKIWADVEKAASRVPEWAKQKPSNPIPTKDDRDAQNIRAAAKIQKAMAMVGALCRPRGSANAREWIMSIPAKPDKDPDLVIADGLIAGREALETIAHLEERVAELTKELDDALNERFTVDVNLRSQLNLVRRSRDAAQAEAKEAKRQEKRAWEHSLHWQDKLDAAQAEVKRLVERVAELTKARDHDKRMHE